MAMAAVGVVRNATSALSKSEGRVEREKKEKTKSSSNSNAVFKPMKTKTHIHTHLSSGPRTWPAACVPWLVLEHRWVGGGNRYRS